MNEELIKYLALVKKIEQYQGKAPQDWILKVDASSNTQIKGDSIISLSKCFNREVLKKYLDQEGLDNISILISILAWGNCKISNAREIFKKENLDNVLKLVDYLNSNKIINREEAFGYFIENKRKAKLFKGLGIAYFTKLLWFIRPDLNGYILDQYTARSVNYIIGKPLIKLESRKYVSVRNNKSVYENYCKVVEEIAEKIALNPENTEERLFGGDYPEWRNKINNH
jgi:hypothetical protein